MTGDFDQSQVISERERSYWLCSGCGRCLVFPFKISTWLLGHKLLILQLNSTLQDVSENIEERNRHYSNRILIHIWSALPSLTVWSEFASDWQPALIDGSWTADSRSALTGCFPPVCEILQMPLGAPEDTEEHDFFFRLPVSCTTVRI